MGVGFVAGAETVGGLMDLVRFAKTVEGLQEIRPVDIHPDRLEVMLWFENQEEATACQWMLEALGAEGRKHDGETGEILPEGPAGHDG